MVNEKMIKNFLFNPKEGKTIFNPEGKGPGFWIGAPTIIWDKETNKYFLYVRVRNPRPEDGKVKPDDTYRGYKCQIYESDDGIDFNLVWEMRKHEIGARSMEQAALIKIEGKFHIILSYESPGTIPRWKIVKQTANHPSEFTPQGFEKMNWNVPFFCKFSIKDPIIKEFNNKYYLFIDYIRLKKPWTTTGILVSTDGDKFEWLGEVFTNSKDCEWAQFLMRLTSVFEINEKYLGFFDGTSKLKNVCDEKSGICSGDKIEELEIWSLEKPAYQSEYGKGSVRYLYALKRENIIDIYYDYTELQGEHVLKKKSVQI